MNLTDLSPDQVVFWRWGWLSLNETMLFTWVVMAVLAAGSWMITRRLSDGPVMSKWQNLLEVIVLQIRDQIREICSEKSDPYLPFIGTLFLFIAASVVLGLIPGFHPPTSSLSTTSALAICVFISVPAFAIARLGWREHLRRYTKPSILMLPFNILGEVSRTLAMAVRLFGNTMSEAKIVAILLLIAPVFFPVLAHVLGLLIGMIQAYIFCVLAIVYIASATQDGAAIKKAIPKEQTPSKEKD